MIRRQLEALIRRTRGSGAAPRVLVAVEQMGEEEATQWYRLLTNLQADAEAAGRRKGAQEPWR